MKINIDNGYQHCGITGNFIFLNIGFFYIPSFPKME